MEQNNQGPSNQSSNSNKNLNQTASESPIKQSSPPTPDLKSEETITQPAPLSFFQKYKKWLIITTITFLIFIVGVGVYIGVSRNNLVLLPTPPSSTSTSNAENVPPIPRANVLFVIKDEEGNLVDKPTVKVEFLYDNSYYNYDYEVNFTDNPQLVGITPSKSVSIKFYVIKFGYETLEIEGTNDEEFWEKYNEMGDKGIVDEATRNPDIPLSTQDLAQALAEDATLLRVATLKKTDEISQSFDQLKYSNSTILLLYISEDDSESDLIKGKWSYLINKYPELITFEVSKDEADDILANDRLIKANESVIILYRHGYDDALYYGEQINFEAMLGYRVFAGSDGFSSYEKKVQYLLNQE